MINDSVELRLIRKILELNDGEYSVNTSKGNFIVKRKNKKIKSDSYNKIIDSIIIEREDKTIFGEYRLKSIKGYTTSTSNPIYYDEVLDFYPENINVEYGFEMMDREVIIYGNEEKTKYYRIDNNNIYYHDENNAYPNKYYNILNNVLYIYHESRFLHGFLLGIDLDNFDRIIKVNNKNIKIAKDKNFEEELEIIKKELEDFKDNINNSNYIKYIIDTSDDFKLTYENINTEDFKNIEKEMLNIYKMYLEVQKRINYTFDISTLREIVYGLNNEFSKIKGADITFITLQSKINKSKEEKFINNLCQLNCGIYFINIPNDLMQIDVKKNRNIVISGKLGKILDIT